MKSSNQYPTIYVTDTHINLTCIHNTCKHLKNEKIQTPLDHIKQLEIHDTPQKAKVRHTLSDTIGVSPFALIANATDCVDIQIFGETHLTTLRNYFPLEYGMASHDTIRRVMMILTPRSFKTSKPH